MSDRDSLFQTEQKAATPALALGFITLTERPASQMAKLSYTIRSHAMQSFSKAKKRPKSTKANQKRHLTTEVKSADQLSGKFKLSTWSRKSSKRRQLVVKAEASEAGSPDCEAGLVRCNSLRDFAIRNC